MDLVELLQREIQDWKMKYSKLLVENVNLRGFKSIVMNNPTKYSKASGTCVTAELKKDRGIGHNGPPESIFDEKRDKFRSEVEALKQQLFVDKKDADEALANALALNESHQKLNGKLQVRITELEEDNKKLTKQIEDYIEKRVDASRRSGM